MIEGKFPEKLIPSLAQDFQAIYDISLVIPTRNEAGNIEPLLMGIHQAVKGVAAEVVFVDDSDGVARRQRFHEHARCHPQTAGMVPAAHPTDSPPERAA